MRKRLELFDKKGFPVKHGDMLKVFHFKAGNRNHWMYKRIIEIEGGWLRAYHYPFTEKDGWYDLQGQADTEGVLRTCEIVAADLALQRNLPNGQPVQDFMDRPRRKVSK